MANLMSDRGGGSLTKGLTVVGIGASAGGLQALEHFFDNLAHDTTMAFVVVQHLSPDFKSLMDELLARHTTLPIHFVENGVLVEAGHVYLIPPKKEMIISSGRLLLSERDRQHELTLPIDVFFRSLAQHCGHRSIAIVLSPHNVIEDAPFTRTPVDARHRTRPDERPRTAPSQGPENGPFARYSRSNLDLGDCSRDQLGALEAELDYTKENLQSAIEQLETRNEELQASNEELMSSNEELQSTNEELQSVNEELYTVNAEYQSKIGQLTELTNDMDNLLASTEIGTIFLDENLRIRKFTPQVADSFNLMPQDLGRSIETFTNTMQHPELADDVRQVLATGTRVEREVQDLRGRSFFLRILPYRAKGGTCGAVITFIEISGLKAAEEALFHERDLLDSLLTSIPDAIYFRDTRGKFIRANPALAARVGLDDPTGAIGKTPLEMPSHETALELHHQDEEILRTGEAQHYKLEQRTRGDGLAQWDLATRLPLRGRDGEVVGLIGVFRDVTEQKLAEEKILESVVRRDEFLAMLSHELRNPLASVVTATQLLKDEKLELEAVRLVDVVDRQSHQMARLLDDLLEASRVTQNKVEIRKLPMDLRAVVEEAAAAALSMMSASDLQFTFAIDPRPLTVEGDAARLQQVCINLLTNAAKYTPRGGRVFLEATRDGTDAIIRVRDDGVGIPRDMLKAVFELFVQSSRTIDRAQGGIGVGLTLARSLIDMHGGTVHAASDGEGKGSLFTVRLPLSTKDIDELEVVKRGSIIAAGARIALIEDNEDTRVMMSTLLSRSGFDVRTASDGLAAVVLIEEFAPHAALVDVGLPGIDGFEVARRVRANSKNQQVTLIALTGYGQLSDRATAIKAGFDAHLVKPVRLEQLLAIMARHERQPAAPPSPAKLEVEALL